MGTPPDLSLSPPEKRTLQKVAEGEFQGAEFDWVALQRLKALGLVEERSTVAITAEGRRVLLAPIATAMLMRSPLARDRALAARLHPPRSARARDEGAGRRRMDTRAEA